MSTHQGTKVYSSPSKSYFSHLSADPNDTKEIGGNWRDARDKLGLLLVMAYIYTDRDTIDSIELMTGKLGKGIPSGNWDIKLIFSKNEMNEYSKIVDEFNNDKTINHEVKRPGLSMLLYAHLCEVVIIKLAKLYNGKLRYAVKLPD